MARIPFADSVLVRLPEEITDEDAILCSDVFPTGYVGAHMADIKEGDIVAIFGCGPVGQMAIASAKILGAKRIIAVDVIPDRLVEAENQGALAINYDQVDPVKELKSLSNGFGPDAVIDAVGVDAQRAHSGPAAKRSLTGAVENVIDQKVVAPQSVMFGDQWRQEDAPNQVLLWAVESVRKSGVISIIGVYPQTAKFFPIGLAMQKCLTVRMANCSHAYSSVPKSDRGEKIQTISNSLFEAVSGVAIECYEHFDKREPGWIKVELEPQAG